MIPVPDTAFETEEARRATAPVIYHVLVIGEDEYPIPPEEVVSGGVLDMEAPLDFSDLVAGSYSVTLKDSRGLYDPHSSQFLWRDNPQWWQDLKLRLFFGYESHGRQTPRILLYEGWVRRWGPHRTEISPDGAVSRTLEIYTEDALSLARRKMIGTADAYGRPNPLVHGALVMEAKRFEDTQLLNPGQNILTLRAVGADFETGDTSQLSEVITAGGGTFTVTGQAAFRGSYGARAAVSASNARAYGKLGTDPSTHYRCFATVRIKINRKPSVPEAMSARFFGIYDSSGNDIFGIYPDNQGRLYVKWGTTWWQTTANIGSAYNAWVRLSLGYIRGSSGIGLLRVRWDNAEVLEVNNANFTSIPYGAWAGIQNGSVAESWELDIDDFEYHNYWYPCWFYVGGGPFQKITDLWVDGILIPRKQPQKTQRQKLLERKSKNRIDGKQKKTKTGWGGISQYSAITWSDYNNEPLGNIMAWVEKDNINNIADILIDIASYGDIPVDSSYISQLRSVLAGEQYCCCFEDISVTDALAEIGANALLTIWIEQGVLRVRAAQDDTDAPVRELTDRDGSAVQSTIDQDDLAARVMVKWGWYDRDPALHWYAENHELLETGLYNQEVEEIDLSYGSPLATAQSMVARAKAITLVGMRGPREVVEFVGRLPLLRLELMDKVIWNAHAWRVMGKSVQLEPPWSVTLKLVRWL